MDRGWFIGHERIPRTKSEEQMSSTFSGTSKPCRTIKLTEMLRADQPDAVKKPVPIRPPSPRAPQLRGQERHRGLSCEPTHKAISHSMDRGWFIGHERVLPSKSEEQMSSSCNSVSRPCMTIKLTEMLQADQPNAVKKPVPIRPPSPRAPQPRVQELHRSLSCEPTPKPIIRQRSHSLPSPTEKKKHCRNVGVRFVDSLGVDLEDIRLFRSGEDPFVPHHVTFRLLMGAELADGRHQEISLPYLKPVFAQQPGDQPGFLHRLHEQKVCLERVLCFELGVIGITQVLNLGFEKDVTARYSFTEWKSCTETKASWVSTVTKTWEGGGGQLSCDTFRFHLPVPPVLQPGAVLQFAIQYKVCGAEFWDNNDGENYKLVCHNYKLTVPKECEDSMLHFI